jgi:hypothetical protein
LIPTIAIGRADIWTNNPAFGLNALGGAVSLQMKDGFNYNGFEFDASGGSYGRVGGSMQYGVRSGEWGLYLAAEGFKDDGWRYQSPSRIGASTAISVGGGLTPRSTSSRQSPTTISVWSDRRRCNSSTTIIGRSTPGRRPPRTRRSSSR